ncbi:MAG: hypothetical protein C0597_10615, partial [Marinilabiliales bacterium]
IDIALSAEKQELTSIQNQVKGKIKKIIHNNEGVFCVVHCGFDLFVEISQGIINNLYLHEGQNIYCQIKANDFDVVHVFDIIESGNNTQIKKHSKAVDTAFF